LAPMRVFATSDLHVDFRENWMLLKSISDESHQNDVLIVAGDIAHRLDQITATLSLLKSKFSEVFYLPGNHELWVRGESGDSIQKLNVILESCDQLGVHTAPMRVGPLWIVPLFSWYDETLDDDLVADPEDLEVWADFRFCRWPSQSGPVVDYMLGLNSDRIRDYDAPVISFSHFLPRRELMPPTDFLLFKGLPRVAGSILLDRQIRALSPLVHVFGHTHINCDKTIDGIRYVQNAVLYPRERDALTRMRRVFWKGGGPLFEITRPNDGM